MPTCLHIFSKLTTDGLRNLNVEECLENNVIIKVQLNNENTSRCTQNMH